MPNDYRCSVDPRVPGKGSKTAKNIDFLDICPSFPSRRNLLDVGSSPGGSPGGVDQQSRWDHAVSTSWVGVRALPRRQHRVRTKLPQPNAIVRASLRARCAQIFGFIERTLSKTPLQAVYIYEIIAL